MYILGYIDPNSQLPSLLTLPNAYQTILFARNLTRSFGGAVIIPDLSLELKRGEVLGLLGHNGAGKTTTLQMLTGCLTPDSGQIEICGLDLNKTPALAKTHLGYLPETPPLYRELPVETYLSFTAKLRRMDATRISAALKTTLQRCGLESVRKKTISTLSKGYQQRVGIAQAIIHSPDVIILDEPTVGLDPVQIRDIRDLIRELGNTSSVILSTHLLSEVESVCDRVEIMQKGRLIYSDSSLRMQHYDQRLGYVISLRHPPELCELENLAGITSVEKISPTQFRLYHAPGDNPGDMLLDLATQRGWQLEQLTPLHHSLEDVFSKITGDECVSSETQK